MIAGMAGAGFLLSPTISTARDFVALRSNIDVLADSKIISIKLHQESSHAFWGDSFGLDLSRFRVPPDPNVDVLFAGTLGSGPAIASLPNGGECVIDSLGGRAIDKSPMDVHAGAVSVKGWAMISSTAGIASGRLRLALTPSEGGSTLYSEADRFQRPDVDSYFGLHTATSAGFSAQIDMTSLHGRYDLKVVQDGPDGSVVCSANDTVIER